MLPHMSKHILPDCVLRHPFPIISSNSLPCLHNVCLTAKQIMSSYLIYSRWIHPLQIEPELPENLGFVFSSFTYEPSLFELIAHLNVFLYLSFLFVLINRGTGITIYYVHSRQDFRSQNCSEKKNNHNGKVRL